MKTHEMGFMFYALGGKVPGAKPQKQINEDLAAGGVKISAYAQVEDDYGTRALVPLCGDFAKSGLPGLVEVLGSLANDTAGSEASFDANRGSFKGVLADTEMHVGTYGGWDAIIIVPPQEYAERLCAEADKIRGSVVQNCGTIDAQYLDFTAKDAKLKDDFETLEEEYNVRRLKMYVRVVPQIDLNRSINNR